MCLYTCIFWLVKKFEYLQSNANVLHWLIKFTIVHDMFARKRFSWFSVFVCLRIFRFYWYPWLEFVILLYIHFILLPTPDYCGQINYCGGSKYAQLRTMKQREHKVFNGVLQKNPQYWTQNVYRLIKAYQDNTCCKSKPQDLCKLVSTLACWALSKLLKICEDVLWIKIVLHDVTTRYLT